jgi:hypothetical protein
MLFPGQAALTPEERGVMQAEGYRIRSDDEGGAQWALRPPSYAKK